MSDIDTEDQALSSENEEFETNIEDEFSEEPDKKNQKKKISRPIRLKLILAFGIVLSISLSVFLYYSLQLFFSDKETYVIESATNHVNYISTAAQEKVKSFEQRIDTYKRLAEVYPEELKRIVNAQSSLFAFYHLSKNLVLLKTFVNSNLPDDLKETLNTIEFTSSLEELASVKPGEVFIIPSRKFTQSISAIVGIKNEKTQNIHMGILDFTDINKIASENKLFNSEVKTYDGISIVNQSKVNYSLYSNVKNSKFNIGTLNFKDKLTAHHFFAAYERIPAIGLIVIASTTKKNAFQAAYDLLRKTIGYGLILLGFAFAIAVLLAMNITRPLRRLVDQTERVTAGEFDKVELITSSDEIGVLGESISNMSQQILELLDSKQLMIKDLSQAKTQLEEYSQKLEGVVETKTTELQDTNIYVKSLLESITQGYFIIDLEGKVVDFFTKSCLDLFEMDMKGSDFISILRYQGNQEEEDAVRTWIDSVYQGKLDFEALEKLGPQEVSFQAKDTDGNDYTKYIGFSYSTINDEFGDVLKIVVLASDITKIKDAQLHANKKDSEVEMVIKILSSRKGFVNFLESSKYMINELKKEAAKNNIDKEKITLSLATMAANFASFSILPLNELCLKIAKDIEEKANQLEFRQDWEEFLMPRFEKLMEEFHQFCSLASRIVGFDVTKSTTYQRISSDRLEDFAKMIKKKGDLKMYSQFRYDFIYSPLSAHFRSYYDLVFEIADQLGKKVHPLKFTNPSIRINEMEYRDFLTSLVHLFRNIMDHEIEMPIDRKRLNKDEQGLITIDSRLIERKDKPVFRLSITDDGRGVDPKLIRDNIIKKQLNIPHEDISDEDLIYVIFSPEYSSRDVSTGLTGRGFGLSAIRDEVSKLGGEIEIKTKILKGTSFIFYLPYTIIE